MHRYSKLASEVVKQQMEDHLVEIQNEIKNDENAQKDDQDRSLVNYSFDASWQLSRTARNSPTGHAT